METTENTGTREMDDDAGTAGPGGARSTAMGAMLRAVLAVLGGLSLVGGLTWLLLNFGGPHPVIDVLVGAVLVAGGLVLLMPHRVRLPRLAGALGAGLGGLIGTAAGLLVGTAQSYATYAYVAGRGFPFYWLQRGASASTPETARSLARASAWQVDVAALAVNLLFWAYAGLLVAVLVVLVRRAQVAGRR